MQTQLSVQGMTCDHCRQAVERALKGVAGVAAVQVDLAKGQAVVEHENTVASAALAAAVNKTGFIAKAR